MTGSSNDGSPPVGGSFNSTFQMKDRGPVPAAGVTFDDALPASILLGGTVTVDDGDMQYQRCHQLRSRRYRHLGVGKQLDITIAAMPTAAGVFADTATVAMTGADTYPPNDVFTVTVRPK